MAKGQVTEEDIEIGLREAGGFSGLTRASTRRDSPFGVEHAKQPIEEKTIGVETSTTKNFQKEVNKPIEVKRKVEVKKASSNSVKKSTEELIVDEKTTKAGLFSERITLNITPDMRERAEMLARGLQRRKLDKSERITANTLYRVAIQALLESEEFVKTISPNTEEELLEKIKVKK